jgi:hypothetical protein
MRLRWLHLTYTGLTLLLLVTPFARADSLLVGTALTTRSAVVMLCPNANNCLNLFSGFSTSQAFTIDDVKVLLSGPEFAGFSTDGSFQVSILTQPGNSASTVATVGSGNLPFTLSTPSASVSQVFDFSGLSIALTPATQYYLAITGANLGWDATNAAPLTGSGTLGRQLACSPSPPTPQCSQPISDYDFITADYMMQISGNSPTVTSTPEPSSLLLLATGILGASSSLRKRLGAHV